MKKLKLLPTILMLVLCVGVLAIGIYAVTPTKNTISGSITINASSHNVLITAHHVPYGTTDFATVCTQANQIGGLYDLRSGGTIDLTKESLNFVMEGVNDLTHANVQPRLIVLKLQNPSTTQELGAYFSEDKTITDQLTDETKSKIMTSYNVPTVKEDESSTTSMATASLSKYTKIPVGDGTTNGVAFATIQIALNDLPTEKLYLKPNFAFNIEEFNINMITNEIALDNNTTTTVTAKVTGTKTTNATKTLSTTEMWAPTLDVSATKYTFATYQDTDAGIDFLNNPVYTLDPMIITYTVDNTSGSNPVRIELDASCADSNYTVHTVNNSYIPAGESGEASVQVIYNIPSGTYITELPEALRDVKCDITVTEWTAEELADVTTNIKDRIVYDETGIANKTLHYYIEYGTNPYYTEGNTDGHREKLRWYIWAYDNGGTKTAIGSINPKTDTTENRAYYFISEYALDGPVSSGTNTGISFQNSYAYEYTDGDNYGTNNNKNSANYYAESNVRDFLNGTTARNSYAWSGSFYESGEYTNTNYSYYFSAGTGVNFYERFGLTEDPLYSKIQSVTLNDLYSNIYYSDSGDYGDTAGYSYYSPEGAGKYAEDADKFWCLSYGETALIADDTARVAKKLSSPTTSAAWWLRSPFMYGPSSEFIVDASGGCTEGSVDYSRFVRPAFKIVINEV